MTSDDIHDTLQLGRRLNDEVLAPMKSVFVGKDEVIDLLGVSLVAGENLFILGPPGTAKTALVHELSRRIDGRVFEYLLTRFTEPNELFGPFDIRKLRDGELITNTDGMLPEADLVFLDELLNANSAILNSLLTVLNERMFRRGREQRQLPTLMVVGASNRLPEDDVLHALFDRFLLRVHCDNVLQERLGEVLTAGWRLDQGLLGDRVPLEVAIVRRLQEAIKTVDLTPLLPHYIELIGYLRQSGIPVSDRRAVKLQRLIAASALICGRLHADVTDQWVLRYIWEREEQQEILASLVKASIDKADQQQIAGAHPRATADALPNAEELARDLERIGTRLQSDDTSEVERAQLRDQLGLLAPRCQWIVDPQQRRFLEAQLEQLWKAIGEAA